MPRIFRKALICLPSKTLRSIAVTLLVAGSLFTPVGADAGIPILLGRHSRDYFRNAMPDTVRGDHPAIRPVAAAIRAVTQDPLQQIVMVNDVTHLLVDYDHDERVYGPMEFHATFEEMLARRRQAGWLYLRDDCDGRAVFAAHLLAALGIPWRLDASYWKEHAWVVARVNGIDYDLLDLRLDAPETNRLSYKLVGHLFVRPTKRVPPFAWRKAWAQRTGRDLHIGLTLGMLTLDSTAAAQRERYSTDWTQRAPHGRLSPVDDRGVMASVAGFPYGEAINAGALAGSSPLMATQTANGSVNVGGASAARTSAN